MIISELIERLQVLQAEHGDLRCVTPGFDESEQDDVATVDLVWVLPNVRKKGHCGQHDEVNEGTLASEKAVVING